VVNVRHVHLVIPLAIFLLAGNGRAELYKYVDEQGRVHFSNAPADVRYRPLRVRDSRAAAMRRYEKMIRKAAAEYGIDPSLIKAVIKVESNFDRYAVSHKGARGLMQLMPATAREMNVDDPFDPSQNIEAGSRYLRMMLDRFDNDLSLSLAAYNAGPGLVGKVGRVPEIKETRNYVSKVKKAYHRYK
jgi:soluble lytic murein transglycosylase